MGYRIDLTGKRYGRLEVLEYSHTEPKSRKSYWVCRCDCGTIKTVCASNLRSGNTSSCGCGEQENLERRMSEFYDEHHRHGESHSRLHRIWAHMKERCDNPNCKDYPLYGGRGVKVCEEWTGEHGFENFNEWALGHGYADRLSIDRIDTNGDYEPNNCRWATDTTQANNRRANRRISISGETRTLAEWCRRYGKNYGTIYTRLEAGMSPEEAFDLGE